MNANLLELAIIAHILGNHNIACRGISHANFGCSTYQLQYKAFGLEFYMDRSELEQTCKGHPTLPLSIFVKYANSESTGAFYQLLK